MKYLLLSLFAGVFSLYVHGVDNLRLPDVRSVGMGGNVATQSILFNPALIVDKDKKSIHLEYFNRYMLKELGTMSGSFYYPNQLLSAGVDISVFGFDGYSCKLIYWKIQDPDCQQILESLSLLLISC